MPVVQTGLASIITSRINKKYDTNILIKKVDLSYFGNIKLKNVEIDDHHNDSLIYIDKLSTSLFSYKKALDNNLEFDEIDLEGVIFNLRTHKGEENDNLSIFIEKFDTQDSLLSDSPTFLLTSANIHLKNANFYLFNENKQDAPLAYFKDINGEVRDFKIRGPEVFAQLRGLSFKENHGLIVTSMASNFSYAPSRMLLADTQIITEDSKVNANISMNYNREDLVDFNNKVQIEADFSKSDLALVDLNKFYKELGKNDKVSFSTKFSGTLNNFSLKNLKLVSRRNSVIDGTFHFVNAIDSKKGFLLEATIYEIASNYENLKLLLPNILGNTMPSSFRQFGRFSLAGSSVITKDEIDAKLTIKSALGRTISDLKMTKIDNIDKARYVGKVEFIDLELGKIIKDSLVGKLSLVADVDGSGFTLEKLNTSLKGTIYKHQYKGYTYKDIDVNGVFQNQSFEGSLISRDENLKMVFKGLADLSSDVYKFDFTADVGYSNFNKLNLFKRDSLSILKGRIDIDFSGNKLDNITGIIKFSNTSYTNQNDNYFFKDFTIDSEFIDSVRVITMKSSDIVDGKLKGNFKFDELDKLASNSLGSIYTNYHPTKVTKGQFLEFNFKIYNKIVDVFFPKVKLGPNTAIKGKIDSDQERFELSLKSPSLEAYENLIENIDLQIDNKNPLFNTLLSIDKVNTKVYDLANINLVNITLNDTLFFRTEFIGGKKLNEKYDLSFYHTINENKKSVVGLKPSSVNVKNNLWTVNPSNNDQNKVVFDKSLETFAFDKFNFISNDQMIDFAGVMSGGDNKDVTLNLKDVRLSGITPYIDNFNLKGLVNGSINYRETNGDTFPIANLTINDFKANDIYQGNLYLSAQGDKSIEQYLVEARLENENLTNFLIKGEVDISNEAPIIFANYELEKFNIKTLNDLGKDVINNIRGELSGNGVITGLLNNPDINGFFRLENAGLAFPYLNVDYDLMGSPKIEVKNQTLTFLPLTLLDKMHDTEGQLSGTITHYRFSKWFLDLKVDTDNLLVLNTEEKEDIEYYGTVFTEANATIKGYTDELVIDVVGKTNRGTEFIIPLSDVSTIGNSKLINFITTTEKGVDFNSEKNEIVFDKIKGLTLNFDLTVTKDAIAEIVVDKNTGSILRGSGDGNMLIEINTNGRFEIYGSYVVDNGIYEFRNIVNKDFIVQPGGLVVWNGNPFDAFLNISAIYRTKANPSVLLENITNSNRKIDIDLVAKITGQLLDSDIEFDVKIPDQSSVVNSELQFKLSDEDKKMTQFFALLTTGSFINIDDGSLNFDGNAALASTVSEKIANVLSGILQSKGDKFQFGVAYNIASKDDVRFYNLNDQLDLSFSSTIGQRVVVNGKVGVPVGSNTQTNIVGEVEVELPLNQEGTLNAKAYTKQNDIEYDVTDAEGYTHGIGLSWRVDFDNSKELADKIFKKSKKSDKKKVVKDSIVKKKEMINFISTKKDSVN